MEWNQAKRKKRLFVRVYLLSMRQAAVADRVVTTGPRSGDRCDAVDPRARDLRPPSRAPRGN